MRVGLCNHPSDDSVVIVVVVVVVVVRAGRFRPRRSICNCSCPVRVVFPFPDSHLFISSSNKIFRKHFRMLYERNFSWKKIISFLIIFQDVFK